MLSLCFNSARCEGRQCTQPRDVKWQPCQSCRVGQPIWMVEKKAIVSEIREGQQCGQAI